MEIFVSHSSQDAQLATSLSTFLESIDHRINVFCSSQIGSIKTGRDYVNEITRKLNECNIFIPLLTSNYYQSHFCMIELGFAYSCLSHRIDENEGDYIYPLAVLPIKKAEALINTPLSRLQVCSINDEANMCAYVKDICENGHIECPSGFNEKIHKFINCSVNKITFGNFGLTLNARILPCKAANVPGEDNDYLAYSVNADGSGYTVDFKAKPFKNSNVYPDFLSLVFQYVDKMNLYDMANLYENAKLEFQINNDRNSLRKIDIEVKHGDSNLVFYRQETSLGVGINNIIIPFQKLKYKALKDVSELCFVIKPSAYIEDEGRFQINYLKITH